MEPFIGQIILFAGNFAPRGWTLCDGQLLAISQHQALFSIIGTTYGGDGKTTFALPDLRSRVPIQPGQGPGLSHYQLGERTGSESVTLTTTQIPSHTHQLRASDQDPSGRPDPRNNSLALADIYASADAGDAMSPTSIANTGGNQPHTNVQPVLALNFIIAMVGIFPSRN